MTRRQRTGLAMVLVSGVLFTLTGGGCSAIVSDTVPDVACVDAPGACPDGMHCEPVAQRCIPDVDGAVGPETSNGDVTVTETGVKEAGVDADATSGPQPLGTACRLDADCRSKLCGSSAELTTTITAVSGPICTSVCCTSADCPSTFVCYAGGTGGGYCIPAALTQRSPAETGGKTPGVLCGANSECRSGLCTGTPSTCVDTCCTANDCGGIAPNKTTCRLPAGSPPPAHFYFYCAVPDPGANGLPDDGCGDSTQCMSEACTGSLCRPPCSSTASCLTVPGFGSGHCVYGSAGSDFFKLCLATTNSSQSPPGTACIDDATCQSTYCDPELKTCANVCGVDADCAPTEACRPSEVGAAKLRCVPKP